MIPQVDFTVDSLSNRLKELCENPHLLCIAASSSAKQGMPEATKYLADVVCDLIDGKTMPKNTSNTNSDLKEPAA